MQIAICIVDGPHRALWCSVQPAPLSVAGLGGRVRQCSVPPAWTPGGRQEGFWLFWLLWPLDHWRRWSGLGGEEEERSERAWGLRETERKQSQSCAAGIRALVHPGKELKPQANFRSVTPTVPSVQGQGCRRPSEPLESPSVLAKVQRAPRHGKLRLGYPEDEETGRGRQGAWVRPRESSPSAHPRRRGSDMKH